MIKIAIIQFPGLNTEYETRREINRAGMKGEFFRWNDDPKKLLKYDGYVIGGGFSYEDRGRAGVIAALDPIMDVIRAQAAKGKPVLGICNGAQILVESGLIPGADGNKLVMSLARNKRIRDGEVLGTGYYNAWVNLKCTAAKSACMFTHNINEGEILRAPIAHGEGRYTTEIPDLIKTLYDKGQMVFRYCDNHGVIVDNFPVNPNGAMFNLAAVCNPAGNVMAIMPHLERDLNASQKLFTSMRDAIEFSKKSPKKRAHHIHAKSLPVWPIANFQPKEKSVQFFISLIITDNEADTHESTVKRLGFSKISLKRTTHIELEYAGRPNLEKTCKQLIQSGVLMNTNKEQATVKFLKKVLTFDNKRAKFVELREKTSAETAEPFTFKLLIREKADYVGISKLSTIQNRLKFKEITGIYTGTIWEIKIPTKSQKVAQEELRKLIQTHIFVNPHRQEAFVIS